MLVSAVADRSVRENTMLDAWNSVDDNHRLGGVLDGVDAQESVVDEGARVGELIVRDCLSGA